MPRVVSIVCCLVVALTTASAWAELVRFEITERKPFADGQSFGDVGPYERISGTLFYAIDPKNAANAAIIDLEHAPRDDDGRVRFEADFFILTPRNQSKSNGALLYDVNNRGRKLALRFFNDAPSSNDPTDGGNGFLMREGYTVVWSGWDGELLPGDNRLQLWAPVAKRAGKRIDGLIRYEICPDKDSEREAVNRGGHGAYRPRVRPQELGNVSWRLRPRDRRIKIPRGQFKLHVSEVEDAKPGQLPKLELEIVGGFRQGYLYEVVYIAQDPLVHGVCFAAVRDLISAIKNGEGEDNPLLDNDRPFIERAHGFGVSQSGRFLREMMYWGFNIDEHERMVFDGVIPHVAGGGLGSFNHRFAQPTVYATQHQHWDFPIDRFPFSYEVQQDPVSKQEDGILRRLTELGAVPKVMHTQSSAEYWSRSGSLVHTDTRGRKDAVIPDNVRIYSFGGTQHGPASFPPSKGKGQTLANPGDYKPQLRALLTALDAWCRDGTAPPPSRYPTLADRTLTHWRQGSARFPAIAGVRYPEVINEPRFLDLGDDWLTEGTAFLPPRARGSYTVLAPLCGDDGNELGCLLPAEVAAPLATFTGWNLRSREAGAENELVSLAGSYIPFPATKAERAATGDRRQSLEDRYGTLETYLEELQQACRKLVRDRYMLAEDTPRIIARQQARAEPLFAQITANPDEPATPADRP